MKFKKLKSHILSEQAVERADVILLCMRLGEKFAEHFIKVVTEGKASDDFHHHCSEMQAWFDEVKRKKIKTTKKVITKTNLIDWFFTCGEDIEDFIPEEYIDRYKKLYTGLLSTDKSVEEILRGLI